MSKPTMPRTLSSKGFSVVELVIVLVVVAVLALGGFFVWQRTRDDSADKKSSDTSQNNQKKDNQTQNEEPVDPSDGGKYLVITEWGVRFPLSESLRGDIDYMIATNVLLNYNTVNDDEPRVYGDIAYITSKKLASVPSSACALTRESSGEVSGGIEALTRSTDRPAPYNDSLDRQIDGKWHSILRILDGVCYASSSGQEESVFIAAVVQALKELEPLKN